MQAPQPLATTGICYYGCLTSQAEVHPIILLLVGFAGFIFLVTLIYYFVLLAKLSTHFMGTKFHPNSNADSRANIQPVPDRTLSWILQAAREQALETEHTSTGIVTKRESPLADSWKKCGQFRTRAFLFQVTNTIFEVVYMPVGIARVVRRHGKAVSLVVSSPQQPQQEVPQYVGSAFSPTNCAQPEMGMST